MELNATKVLKGYFLVENNDNKHYVLSIDNIDNLKIEELVEKTTDRFGTVQTIIPPQTRASFRIIPSESGELFKLQNADLLFADSEEEYEYQVDKALMEYLKSFNIKEEGE